MDDSFRPLSDRLKPSIVIGMDRKESKLVFPMTKFEKDFKKLCKKYGYEPHYKKTIHPETFVHTLTYAAEKKISL